MNQPPILPNIKRMGCFNGEVKHLLGFLKGGDIQDFTDSSISQFELITRLQVTSTHPVGVELFMAHWCRALVLSGWGADVEGMFCGGFKDFGLSIRATV